jgi:type IV pilus assembly protein PilW
MRDAMRELKKASTAVVAHRMAGMSLIELMVAVALGLLILAALTTVFVNSSTSRREIDLTSQQIENGRYAVEILSDDLRLAGYFGEFDPASANGILAVAVPGALPDPCTIPADFNDWRAALYLHLQGYHSGTGLPAGCAAATNIKPNTDIVVVRRARGCSVGDAGCEALDNDKPYFQASLCATEAATTPYILAAGSVAPTLRLKGAAPGACSVTLVAQRQYMTHIYFISTDNGAGVSVPTLKRLEFAIVGGVLTMKEVSLVEGIEQLNIEYGLDCKANDLPAGFVEVWPDGMVDVYTSDPTTYADGDKCNAPVDSWMNVMTARFYVLARNLNPSSGLSDEAKAKTYTLGRNPDGTALTVGPFNDGYRRHVYSSAVRIVNPAGKRDRPL